MIQEISLFLVFFGGITSLSIGSYVLLKDSRSLLNRLFFLMNLTAGIAWAGAIFFEILLIETNPKLALFAAKIEWIGIISVVPIFFLICLIIAKKQKIFKKLSFLIFFCVSLILPCFYVIFSPLFLEKGTFMPHIIFFRTLFLFYFPLFLFSGVFLLLKRYSETNISREKKLIKYFMIGTLVPIMGAATFLGISYALFPLLIANLFQGLTIINSLAIFFFGIGMLVIGIGILHYKIFIDFREILDTMFKTLVDLAIITDEKGVIGLVNQVALNKLKYKEQDLIGKNIQDIIKDGKEKWQDAFQKLKQKGIISEEEIHFLNKKNKEIPFLLDSSIIKVKGKTTGVINIGKEVAGMVSYRKELEKQVKKRTQELEEERASLEIKVRARTKELEELTQSLEERVKERTKELQERIDELERFHKLTIGRELRMVELKQEIKKLKERSGNK